MKIAIIIFEVPSGYFADVLGRRISIISGVILGFFAFLIYSASYNFTGFLIAEIVLGLGSSLISGADSALIYDSLVQLKKEKEYKKIEGRFSAIGNFSEATAAIIGGFIATISLRTPLYVETALMFVAIPLAFSLIEPRRKKFESEEHPIKDILRIVKYSLHGHPEVKWLIIYAAVVGASTLTMVWFIQPYMKLVGLPLGLFGVAWAIFNVSVGIFTLYAHHIEEKLGRKKSLIILIFLSGIGYLLLAQFQTLWAIAFILIFYMVRGISGPILKDYVNKIISSNIRATVLSVKNLMVRLVFSIVGPFIGWTTDLYSFKIAFVTAAGIFLFFGIISLLFLHKNKAL